MQYITISHPKFNSNIYVFRQNLSSWLTKFVDVRNNIGTFLLHPDEIKKLDTLLIKTHYEFIKVKKTINLLENDVYVYGN